jgi:ketosteroid isomerase-like protein
MIRLLALAALLFAAPAMARPAEAVVRDFLTAYAAQDLAAVTALADPAVTMALPFAPGGPVLRGREAARAYLGDVFGKYRSIVLSDVVMTPAADGRTVTVEAIAAFETHAGERHRVGYVWLITVEREHIIAARNYLLPL